MNKEDKILDEAIREANNIKPMVERGVLTVQEALIKVYLRAYGKAVSATANEFVPTPIVEADTTTCPECDGNLVRVPGGHPGETCLECEMCGLTAC